MTIALLAAHTLATLGVLTWLLMGASAAGFGPWGIVLCTGAVLAMLGMPRWPVLGPTVFVTAAYALPRYGSEQSALLEFGALNGLALLMATGGLAAWLLVRAPGRLRVATWWPIHCGFHKPALLLAAFFVWAGISFAVAMHGHPETEYFARHHPVQLIHGALLALAAARLMPQASNAKVMLAALCLLPLLRGLLQAADDAAGTAGLYLDGDLPALAAMALPVAVLAACMPIHRGWRAAALLAATALLWIVALAQNRGAAIGFACVVVALWFNSRHRLRWALMAAGAVGAAAAAVQVLGSPAYLKRFAVLWDPSASHATAALDRATVEQRLMLWRAAAAAISDSPLLGSGPGRETAALTAHLPQASKLVTHNSLLSTAVETGVPGAVLYALVFIAAVWQLQGVVRSAADPWLQAQARMVQAMLCGYLGIGLVISRYDLALAYLLVGWAAALALQARRSAAAQGPP